MAVEPHEFEIRTQGNNQVLDITDQVARCVESGRISNGTATVFVIGSTAGITTTEYEPGLVKHDLKAAFEGVAPQDARYEHEETWHDDNGHAHVRASLLGPSLTVPVRWEVDCSAESLVVHSKRCLVGDRKFIGTPRRVGACVPTVPQLVLRDPGDQMYVHMRNQLPRCTPFVDKQVEPLRSGHLEQCPGHLRQHRAELSTLRRGQVAELGMMCPRNDKDVPFGQWANIEKGHDGFVLEDDRRRNLDRHHLTENAIRIA